MTEANYADAGQWLAEQAIAAVDQALDNAGLTRPEVVFTVHGVGVPIQDPCEGLMWARVATAYQTDGSGAPLEMARINWNSGVAWAFPVDVGIVFCRPIMDEDGAAVPPEDEQAVAQRDSLYRMALLDGMANYYPDLIKAAMLGQKLSPWTPIGPDGAVSGGLVNAIVISPTLCLTNQFASGE